MISQSQTKNLVHKSFEIGILLKGINGLLEIIGGLLLLAVSPQTINKIVLLLTQGELSEDPKDKIANFIINSAHALSLNSQLYGSIFLLSHGIIKALLIAALFKKKLWAYPTAMVVFGLFVIYQVYRYELSHSVWMIILSILDVFVIILTYFEYQNLLIS